MSYLTVDGQAHREGTVHWLIEGLLQMPLLTFRRVDILFSDMIVLLG
jgi:hypothetical protein